MRVKSLVLTLLLISASAFATPVGIRSNNMSNLHGDHPEHWLGATSTDNYHYLRFSTPYYGLRAMRINMEAYYYKHHLHTIRQIASRWVRKPSNPRQVADLENYMAGIAQRLDVEKDSRLWLEDKHLEIQLAKAIIFAENGQQPYDDILFNQVFNNPIEVK